MRDSPAENIAAFKTMTEQAKVMTNMTMDPMTVTKWDLLDGEDLDVLERLTGDQQSLVDYEVILRAGLVTGIADTAFAWDIALRRQRIHGVSDDFDPVGDGEIVRWRDRYSSLFGPAEMGKNMQLSIWP